MMYDVKEFEEVFKEMSEGSGRVQVYMKLSWGEKHGEDFHYLDNHDIVSYRVIGEGKVRLTGDDGICLDVYVYDIYSLM